MGVSHERPVAKARGRLVSGPEVSVNSEAAYVLLILSGAESPAGWPLSRGCSLADSQEAASVPSPGLGFLHLETPAFLSLVPVPFLVIPRYPLLHSTLKTLPFVQEVAKINTLCTCTDVALY